jgi:hypothetical protein
MTDFVTVLRRAVENLEDNNEHSRRMLYDKARTALLGQLRGLDPPLSEDELQRQSEELDAAIEQVETEHADAASPPAVEAGEAPGFTDTPEPATVPQDDPVFPAGPEAPAADQRDAPESEPAPSGAHASFRSAVADTAALGIATSNAARTARETYGHLDDDDLASAPKPSEAQTGYEPSSDVPSSATQAREHHAYDTPADGPLQTEPAKIYSEEYDEGSSRGIGIAVWVIVFLMVAGIAGAAYWQRDALVEVAGSFGAGEEEVVDVAEEPKVDERVPAPDAERSPPDTVEMPAEPAPDGDIAAAPTLPADATRVAQALLVEEGRQGASMTSLGGNVDWTLLDDPEAPEGAQKVIRGMVQIPDKGMSLTLAIRRNLDPELPATHTVELFFDLPADFENGGIAGVAGLIMKATPQSTGQPLIGAVVPVTDDFYLLGLSESSFDRARNIDEMKRRNFIDIPIAYADESRAILSVAKGESGSEVFAQAFEAWGQ